MILGFPRAKQGLCHYDIWGGGDPSPLRPLNRISWNFQELFTTWCHTAPPILSLYSNDFGVSQSKTRTLPYTTWGSGGYRFVSIDHSISSLYWFGADIQPQSGSEFPQYFPKAVLKFPNPKFWWKKIVSSIKIFSLDNDILCFLSQINGTGYLLLFINQIA